MPFRKVANAMVTHPRVSGRGWGGLRRIATAGPSDNLTDQARKILGGPLDPDKYLFTHCTIVASVDTEKVPGVKLGKVRVGSSTVDRRYADYHIKPECSQFVNNNGDSWSRPVLLASYPSFIGGQNFQEHVQIEEKSKGRIIDAVARDIGESVYIDILVATNRKHAGLIADISAGKMSTLSMGCTTDFTLCSQCGHYAVDETDLCEHIRFSKLNTFMDDNGQKRVVAELCGHEDFDETGGVHFIEASWVAVPAFQGAVMRNILKTGDIDIPDSEIRRLLSAPTPSWSRQAISKAAKLLPRVAGFGDEEPDEEAEPEKPAAPFKDLEDSMYQLVKGRVRERLEKEMEEKNLETEAQLPPSSAPNDTLNKEGAVVGKVSSVIASRFQKEARGRYAAALETLVRVASSDAALVDGFAATNQSFGVQVDTRVYRAALQTGALSQYENVESFVDACRKAAGRPLRTAELRVVVRIGSLLSRWSKNNNPPMITTRSS